jgi:hypothetical protein
MIDKYFLLIALERSKKPIAIVTQSLYDNHFTSRDVPIVGRTIIGEGDNAVINFHIDRAAAIRVLRNHGNFIKKGSSIGITRNL